MFNVIKRNPFSVILALLLHGMIAYLLLFGMDLSFVKQSKSKAQVVQAKVVDAAKLDNELNKLKQAEADKKAAEEAAMQQQKQHLQELKRQQEKEKKRLENIKQQRLAEQKAERQRLAKEKKRREAEAKRAAEKKRQQALAAKREAEKRRKAEAEAKRKAAEKKRLAEAEIAAQAAREKALQEQLAEENNRRETERYIAVIKQQIERNWLRPAQIGGELFCTVQVRLIPGGDVLPGGVTIMQSSGNAAFDRSVETAVYKATPLPVPSGQLFEQFRNLKLEFRPGK